MPTMVLRAFNAELSQIPDSVKQETLVQIRMQWWRDAVKSAYSDRPEPNPIILALHEVCAPQCANAVASSNLLRKTSPGILSLILSAFYGPFGGSWLLGGYSPFSTMHSALRYLHRDTWQVLCLPMGS